MVWFVDVDMTGLPETAGLTLGFEKAEDVVDLDCAGVSKLSKLVSIVSIVDWRFAWFGMVLFEVLSFDIDIRG